MNVLTITGSAEKNSSNERLLRALPMIIHSHSFSHYDRLIDFPLFTPQRNLHVPALISEFKKQIQGNDVLVIATPEYVHNIPAVLKNALEWLTSSGELYEKKVIAITYTPHAPRGEKAMQSLQFSLQALNVKLVAALPLYQSELKITADGQLDGEVPVEMLKAVFELL